MSSTEVMRTPRVSGWAIPALRADGMPIDWPTTPHPRWGHPLLRVLVFFVVAALVGGVALGLAFLVDPTGPADGPGMLVTGVGLIVATIVGYVVMTRFAERRQAVETDPGRASGLLGGLMLGALCVLASAAIVWAFGGLTITGVRPFTEIPWVTEIVMTGLFSAVVEEILFRGMLFRLLEEQVGSWIAVGASAALFGSLHLFAAEATWLSTLATIVGGGALFAVVYLLTRSLWWVIGLHAAWNSVLGNVLGVPVSGNVNEGLLITHPTGPDLISGGAYGLEASIVTVVVLTAIASVGLVVAHRRGVMTAPRWARPPLRRS